MEESVLSCVIKDGSLFNILKDICNNKDFWFQPYSWIWSAFQKLYERNSNIDIITVQDELERNNNFNDLSNFDGSFSGYDVLIFLRDREDVVLENYETYAHQVRDDSSKRKIQEILNKSTGWINQGNDAYSVLTNIESELGKVSAYAGVNIKSITNVSDAVDLAFQQTEMASKQNKKYIETGLTSLDEKIGGLFPGQLITIAARQGMGKSSLALTIGMNVAFFNKWKKKVGIFSLEMDNTEYVNRMISAMTGINSLRLKMGKIYDNEWEKYEEARKKIKENSNIALDDTSNITMAIIRNKLRKMKEWGISLAIVDQLGLIADRYPNEQEYVRIDRLSYQFKNMAREFDIPLIIIQQMNRSIESLQREKHREPKTSDLAQAGESAPNLILMITHETEQKVIKTSKIWSVKNRDGATGCVDVKFEAEKTWFRDLTREELEELNPEFMREDE
jgi:replicative DNA helicase